MARSQDPDRIEKWQLRRLLGELQPEELQELEALEAKDAAARERAARFESAWSELSPPPDGAPPELTLTVLAAVRAEREGGLGSVLSTSFGSRLSAAATAATAALGVALGLWLSPVLDPAVAPGQTAAGLLAEADVAENDGDGLEPLFSDLAAMPSMADAYWRALEETGGRLSGLDDGVEVP